MKKWLICLLAALLSLTPLSGALAAGANQLIIGTLPVPQGEIAELIKPAMQDKGYELIVAPFPDESMLNAVLSEGSIGANFFQNQSQLDAYNETVADEQKLAAVYPVYFAPYCIYGGKTETLDALAENATVAIPDDPEAITRSLLLLRDADLLTLKEGVTLETGVVMEDIAGNAKSLTITPVSNEALISGMNEYDLLVMARSMAEEAKIVSDRILMSEIAGSEAANRYAICIAVRAADEKAKWVGDLQTALKSDLVDDYLLAKGYAPAVALEEAEPVG